jgi:hypothetical protein
MAETLYEGPAQGATFYLPAPGSVRFGFSDPQASGYIRSPTGALARVQPGSRLMLPHGEHVLSLYDTGLMVRVTIICGWTRCTGRSARGSRHRLPDDRERHRRRHAVVLARVRRSGTLARGERGPVCVYKLRKPEQS